MNDKRNVRSWVAAFLIVVMFTGHVFHAMPSTVSAYTKEEQILSLLINDSGKLDCSLQSVNYQNSAAANAIQSYESEGKQYLLLPSYVKLASAKVVLDSGSGHSILLDGKTAEQWSNAELLSGQHVVNVNGEESVLVIMQSKNIASMFISTDGSLEELHNSKKVKPTAEPSVEPSMEPVVKPTAEPSVEPSKVPVGTVTPTVKPSVSVEPSKQPTVTSKPKVTVRLDKKAATIYTRGVTSVKLKAMVSGTSKKALFKSSNPKVAKVTSTGTVTAVKAGSTVITATVNGVETTCKVTVKQPSLTVAKEKVTIKKGSRYRIKANAMPAKTITYSSSNKKIAKVDKNGVIKGIKPGKATITVTCNKVSRKIEVKVRG